MYCLAPACFQCSYNAVDGAPFSDAMSGVCDGILVPLDADGRPKPRPFDYLQSLGREMQWETVQRLMEPAEKGVPADAGIFSSAIMALAKSRRWREALELEQVQTALLKRRPEGLYRAMLQNDGPQSEPGIEHDFDVLFLVD